MPFIVHERKDLMECSEIATIKQLSIQRTEKMAAVPCKPNIANTHIESHIFCGIQPFTNNIVYTRFEVLRTFLCVFMSVLRD